MACRSLTPRRDVLLREQEIRKLLAYGLTHQAIAKAVGVDERTIRRHKRRLTAEVAMAEAERAAGA